METALKTLKMRKEELGDEIVRLERDPIGKTLQIQNAWVQLGLVRQEVFRLKTLEVREAMEECKTGRR